MHDIAGLPLVHWVKQACYPHLLESSAYVEHSNSCRASRCVSPPGTRPHWSNHTTKLQDWQYQSLLRARTSLCSIPTVARSQASPSGNRKGSRWVQETAREGVPAASSPPSDWLLSGASWAASASEGLRGCQTAAARHSSLRAHAYNTPQSANLWLAVSGPCCGMRQPASGCMRV